MNHEVDVSNLMFNKTAEKTSFKKYDINVDLEEESSDGEKTILKYSLDLTSNPKNSVINISGNTTLSGEKSEIEEFLKQENEKTPEVVSLIYQELFPLMYIISKNMKIPSPSHTLSQNNIKQFDEQNKDIDSNDDKHESVEPKKENEENQNDQLKEGQSEIVKDVNMENQNDQLKEGQSEIVKDTTSIETEGQNNVSET